MSARVPLDVDLEDRLLYGLTPIRLAYVVVSLLGAFALWSSQWAPTPVRACVCIVVVTIGAIVAWGRWRGRAADAWIVDALLFAVRTYHIGWREDWLVRSRRRAKTPAIANARADAGEAESIASGRVILE